MLGASTVAVMAVSAAAVTVSGVAGVTAARMFGASACAAVKVLASARPAASTNDEGMGVLSCEP